jgi:hypothetical protein
MKRGKTIMWSIMITMVIIAQVFLFAYAYYQVPQLNGAGEIADFSISVTSLLISVVALIISFVTYISIDSVSTISSMEGNVLENEKYTIAYAALIRNYLQYSSQQELLDALCDKMVMNFKKHSYTCIEYADNIQGIIDHLLWFAYVDYNSEYTQKRIGELVDMIEIKYSRLSALSNGNQYLLRENINLIKYVLNYQDKQYKTKFNEKVVGKKSMLDIRGSMISNPISRTIYYDYLGLETMAKLTELLKRECNISGYLFTASNIEKMYTTKLSDDNLIKIQFYIQTITDHFEEAKTIAQRDLLWQGYIMYNLLRIKLFELINVIKHTEEEKLAELSWIDFLNETKNIRKNVWDFVNEMKEDLTNVQRENPEVIALNYDKSFLLNEFEKEYLYVEILDYAYRDSKGELTKKELVRVKDMGENYHTAVNPIYKNIELCCDDILNRHSVK